MKQIRRGVFETNSSSSHSVTISKDRIELTEDDYIKRVDHMAKTGKNKVMLEFGEFGWGWDVLSDPSSKLSYLATIILGEIDFNSAEISSTDDKESVLKLYKNTEGFKLLNSVFKKYCRGVKVDKELFKIGQFRDDETYYINSDTGYIDHQSNPGTLKNFLDSEGVTVEEFLFNSGIEMIIDNDNH